MNEWISVKDRLPQNETWVLCFNGCAKIKMFEQSRNSSEYIFYDGTTSYYCPDGEVRKVTHWTPLPPDPEVKNE